MKPAMKSLNEYWMICNQSKYFLHSADILRAKEHIQFFYKQWQNVKAECETLTEFSLGAKEHYILNHNVEFMELYNVSLRYGNEQSTESFHQKNNEILVRYAAQRGDLKMKYYINFMMLLTCPLYQ